MSYYVHGLREFEQALQELGGQYAVDAARRSVTEALKIPARRIRRNIPRRSGKGRRSIRYRLDKNSRSMAGGMVGSFGRGAWYMRLVERGVQAHAIPSPMTGRGRKRRVNNTKVAFGGRVMSRVQHPGFAGRNYIFDGFYSSRNQMIKEFSVTLHEQIVVQAFRKSRAVA
ncbi:HK97 gp10 family phage protein [Aliidiomarina sp. Khilg15.8]